MKGVIFNLFEEFVCQQFGDEAWEEILDAADLKTQEPFVGPGAYPDEDLVELVTRTIERADLPLADALRAFGRFSLPSLIASHPAFAEGHDAASFLKSVDGVIHVEVRKLFPDATTPRILCEDADDGALLVHYESPRRFCNLLEGFVDGVSDHFAVPVEREHLACMHEGNPRCTLRVRFAAPTS